MDPGAKSRASKAVAIYGLDRLILFIALTVVIQLAAEHNGATVPVIMSAQLALIVAFPLSMLLFKRHRIEANEAVAELKHQRQARKDWIQSELAER